MTSTSARGERLIQMLLVFIGALHVTACVPPPAKGPMIPEREVTRSDSVLAAGRGLVRLVYYIGEYSRASGDLPSDLQPVFAQSVRAREQEYDIWGRPVGYFPSEEIYEIRSAGVDGEFHTADDIVVFSERGRIIPCKLRDEERVVTYEHVAPPCRSY